LPKPDEKDRDDVVLDFVSRRGWAIVNPAMRIISYAAILSFMGVSFFGAPEWRIPAGFAAVVVVALLGVPGPRATVVFPAARGWTVAMVVLAILGIGIAALDPSRTAGACALSAGAVLVLYVVASRESRVETERNQPANTEETSGERPIEPG
jgi:hypothetical protein